MKIAIVVLFVWISLLSIVVFNNISLIDTNVDLIQGNLDIIQRFH